MTNNTEGYNGWANWETWNAVLWARNEDGNYAEWRRASSIYGWSFSKLHNFLKENMPHWFNMDMSGDDWRDVDWDEVTAACIEETES
jgi:hypothetical protein